MQVVSYIYKKIGGGGEIFSRSVWHRGIPDPLGRSFMEVVIALLVFVWRFIVGIALL